MSTKTSTVQPPGRRTPLSLNAGTKSNNSKPANDNSKKDSSTTNKTDKTNSQAERKPSSDKKTTNGVNGKEKETTNGNSGTAKPKTDSSSGTSTPTPKKDAYKPAEKTDTSTGKKDDQKTTEKTSDISSGTSTPKKDSHKSIEKKTTTEAVVSVPKKEDSKVDEKNKEKEKVGRNADSTNKEKEKKDVVKAVVEKKSADKKTSEEHAKTLLAKSSETPKVDENAEIETVLLDSSPENSISVTPVKENKSEEMITSETPVKNMEKKEKKAEETPKKVEPQVQSPPEQLDDVEMMEPLICDPPSPQISAASTPAKSCTETYSPLLKASPKSEIKPPRAPVTHTPDRKSCPRSFSSISGRRSIRPIGDYTFSGSSHFRESYRKINTELDFTTSSMNVTVGSEVPNNDSFSFFSRPRKRDRNSPSRQSTMEIRGDLSPKSPKRAKIELGMSGFFSAMASPITMLRARLSRATVQSTPKKQIINPLDEQPVEDVSGISVEEDLTATEDLTVNPDSTDYVTTDEGPKSDEPAPVVDATSTEKSIAAAAAAAVAAAVDGTDEIKSGGVIHIKETLANTDAHGKKKCIIM